MFAGDNILAMLEIIFLISAFSQAFTPAESSSIPLVVPREELMSANSVIMTTSYGTLLVGYAVAGLLLGFIGPEWLFVVCAVLFLCATGIVSLTSRYDKKKVSKISIERLASGINRVWQEAKSGFIYVKSTSKILRPMIKLAIGWAILGAFITLLPAYSESVLGIDIKLIGLYIIAPAGIGMVISALIFSRRKNLNLMRVINTGFVLVAISLLVFSLYRFYEEIPFAVLLMFLAVLMMGFGTSMIQIPAQTMLHINSDVEKRGRVFGLSTMQLRLALALPALVVGGISDLTSPLITMLIIAVLVFLYSMSLAFED